MTDLHLTIEAGSQPIRGLARSRALGGEVPFCGWIELAELIETARGQAASDDHTDCDDGG